MTIQQCSSNEGAWLFGIAVAPATLSQFGSYVFFLQEWAFASRGIFVHSVEQCLETLQTGNTGSSNNQTGWHTRVSFPMLSHKSEAQP